MADNCNQTDISAFVVSVSQLYNKVGGRTRDSKQDVDMNP